MRAVLKWTRGDGKEAGRIVPNAGERRACLQRRACQRASDAQPARAAAPIVDLVHFSPSGAPKASRDTAASMAV